MQIDQTLLHFKFELAGTRLIPLLDQIFALLTTPFPVTQLPPYQRLLRSYYCLS